MENKTIETPNTEVTLVENQSNEASTTNPVLEGNTLNLKRLNEKFIYELMQVPTASHHEYRMVTFIMIWAKRNGIDYHMDDYGNIYLTKGELAEGEFYPCVTAHLDTVQTKQTLYAKAGAKLDVKTRDGSTTHNNVGKHEIYVDGFGIGGDDKAGVLLGLSMFNYVDKLKACFFLEEETGCQGSQHLDKDWFKNVGYVIGYDSPDLNRAAYRCSGTTLMNKQFFEDNGLAELCKKHGLDDFRSEPFTDVVQIRQKTEIICMNFGTGYYLCHTDSEYCVIEDMDAALDMGVEIIEKLGNVEYKMRHIGTSYSYNSKDADSTYFEGLKPRPVSQYSPSRSYYNDDDYSYNRHSYPSTQTQQPTQQQKPNEDTLNFETVKYITDKYEEYILTIKEEIAAKCKEQDIDFDTNFKEIFNKEITF